MRLAQLALSLGAALPLAAQTVAYAPPFTQALPGNAAVSLPLRWSEGVLQVAVDPALLPVPGPAIVGLRLRRPAFLGEPAYGALQRTLTVRAAFTSAPAAQLGRDLVANRPAGLQVVFGPAAVGVAATSSHGPGDAVGADLLRLAFATPLPVQANATLFLELVTADPPFHVGTEHWVDAVWARDGLAAGQAVALGNGGCSAPGRVLQLHWTGVGEPRRGVNAVLDLRGAAAAVPAFVLLGLDPEHHGIDGSFLGFGAGLGGLGLPGCFQWAPADAVWGGATTALGTLAVSFPVPAAYTAPGLRLGVQVAVQDPGANAAGLGVSNGQLLILDDNGVRDRCASVFFPGPAAASPWAPSLGLMPVLGLEF